MSSEHPSPPQPLPSQTWWGSQRNSPFLGLIIHHTDQNYSYVLNESHFHFSVNFKKVGIELVVLFTESESHSVVSNSLWPHGLYSPWNSPGQNTGVDSLFLLQGILPTQGLNPGLPQAGRFLTSGATKEVLPRGLERQELADLKFWRLRSQWRNGSLKLEVTEIQRVNFSLSVTRVLGYRSNCLLVILKSPNLWKQKASPFFP